MNTSIYIHIPFCKSKCHYCDFASYAGKEDLIDKYVSALVAEINFLPPTLNFLFSTLYIGGGTPTLLSSKQLELIINSLISHSPLVISHYEFSIEANPGTVNKEKLTALRQLGVNRISFGAQTFNARHLKTLGRIHSPQDIYRAVEDARLAGFNNLNLDLIFAIPGQTLAEWQEDLKQALLLQPEHISAYNLQIEEGTPLREMTKDGLKKLSEEEELAMYEYTIETLIAHGYQHYEISNFAKPGSACQHNVNYWKNGNYIGIGAGAHSHWNGKRWANTNSVEEYTGSGGVLRNGIRHASDVFCPTPNATDQRETFFLGLRLLDGIETEKFKGFEKEVDTLLKKRLLEKAGSNYRLTRKGLYLANEVFMEFV